MNVRMKEVAETVNLARRVKRRAGMLESGTSLSAIDGARPGTKPVFLAAFARLGSVAEACAETNVKPWRALPWLQKANLLKGTDRLVYGTAQQQYGREAEIEFQRLVPDAIDCNANFRENNPAYDFVLNGHKIDVKSGALNARGRWTFEPERSSDKRRGGKPIYPDAFVFFAMTGKAFRDGYRLFLFPALMVLDQTQVNITPDRPSRWWDFEIEQDELATAMRDLSA